MRYGDYLYVSYSTNKELVEYTRIPLAEICDYTPTPETADSNSTATPGTSTPDSSAVQPADSARTDAIFVQKKAITNIHTNKFLYDTKGRIHNKRASFGKYFKK